MSDDQNGWGESSKLVLKELETLGEGMTALRKELEGVKGELTALKAREDKVVELIQWKQRVDDVVSPIQLKELQEAVDDLKLFKTKAVTIFLVVQSIVGIAIVIVSKIL